MLSRGPLAEGRSSLPSLSFPLLRLRSGEFDIEGDNNPSKGIGIPVSVSAFFWGNEVEDGEGAE